MAPKVHPRKVDDAVSLFGVSDKAIFDKMSISDNSAAGVTGRLEVMRVRLGYQLSITALFVAVVLTVGLVLVFLSFDRARSISRSACQRR